MASGASGTAPASAGSSPTSSAPTAPLSGSSAALGASRRRHGRRVALIGHSRGGHYARALAHPAAGPRLPRDLARRRPARDARRAATPTRGRGRRHPRSAAQRTGRARSPDASPRLRLRVRARLRTRRSRPTGCASPASTPRATESSAGSRRSCPTRDCVEVTGQPRRPDLQPQDLPRDRGRARRPELATDSPSSGEDRSPCRAPPRPPRRCSRPPRPRAGHRLLLPARAAHRGRVGAACAASARFVDDEVLPVIGGYWERAELPWPLIRRLGELGIVGEDIAGLRLPGPEPDRVRAGAHGAQPRRRQPRDVARRAVRAGHEVDRDARLRGAEAALAAGDGPAARSSARSR